MLDELSREFAKRQNADHVEVESLTSVVEMLEEQLAAAGSALNESYKEIDKLHAERLTVEHGETFSCDPEALCVEDTYDYEEPECKPDIPNFEDEEDEDVEEPTERDDVVVVDLHTTIDSIIAGALVKLDKTGTSITIDDLLHLTLLKEKFPAKDAQPTQ